MSPVGVMKNTKNPLLLLAYVYCIHVTVSKINEKKNIYIYINKNMSVYILLYNTMWIIVLKNIKFT